jgi:MFS transporter, DHA2 family, multidrug resistance protein
VNSYIAQAQPGFLQQTGDPAAAQQMTWQSLDNLRTQQASALSYFDCFLSFAVVAGRARLSRAANETLRR